MTRIATHSIPLTLTILLSCLLSDVEAAPRPVATPLTMNLLRRTPKADMSNDEWVDWANSHRENLKVKYGSTTASAERRRATSGTNLLIDLESDSSYIGSLAVGTPPQTFNVIMDTGSSDFWLASPQCETCGTTPTFNPSTSTSFKQVSDQFSVDYGSGSASGLLGQDSVQMAGFTIPNQVLGVCGDVSQQFLSAPISGLMGLGFQSIAQSGASPFWQSLASSNAWSEQVMAFAITRFNNLTGTQNLEPGGTFTMGATNQSLFEGDIEYTNIPSGEAGFWVLPMSTITVQGKSVSVPASTNNAAIDTGTTLIAGPQSVVEAVYAQIPNSQALENPQGYFAYPCETEVNVALAFGGQSWSISPTDFNSRQLNQEFCVGALFSIDLNGTSTPPFIVGDTFIKNVYTAFKFDPPSVGFAKLSAEALAQSNVHGVVPTATTNAAAVIVSATASIQSTSERTSSAATATTIRSSSAGSALSPTILVLAGLVGAVLAA